MEAALKQIDEVGAVGNSAESRVDAGKKRAQVISIQKAWFKEILNTLPSLNPEALTITQRRPRKRPSSAVLESQWDTGLRTEIVTSNRSQLKELWRNVKESLTKLMPSPDDMRRWARKTELQQDRSPLAFITSINGGTSDVIFNLDSCVANSTCDIMEQVGLTAPAAARELRYGICNKGSTALYARADSRSIKLERLVAGQLYRVLCEKNGWVQVNLDAAPHGQRRKGWIEARFHCSLTPGEFKLLKSGDQEMVRNYLKAMRISA